MESPLSPIFETLEQFPASLFLRNLMAGVEIKHLLEGRKPIKNCKLGFEEFSMVMWIDHGRGPFEIQYIFIYKNIFKKALL